MAYVEPSVRPDDARYGENPNRLQTHTQFQVILKPDPGDPQELYLGSLEALGIDVRGHDVRFVEDNWASPALGAWGLGWEVWLDGLEITQFTYFQQAGGMTLDPVSVEITYGIERIMMALQGVDHFKKIAYAPGISYGEAFGQAEYEMSRYYLDDADVEANKRLFEEFAAEARRMLDARLPVPAHSFVLKCSHIFNVLDARGSISTTERARAFGRMRGLAREVASLWAERRAELGHPLGVAELPAAVAKPSSFADVVAPATLLFEIGTEELPPHEVIRTVDAVRSAVSSKLDATRLTHGAVTVHGTPRRIVVLVPAVSPREPDAERTVRGPRVSAAFDGDGNPTKAVQGFARGQGVEVSSLGRVVENGVEFVALTKSDAGRGAVEVLSGLLAEVVSDLRSEKNMKWNDPKLSFTRPIRWLLALLGETPVPVAVSSLASGTTTRVHRTAAEPVVPVSQADGYLEFLESHGIQVDCRCPFCRDRGSRAGAGGVGRRCRRGRRPAGRGDEPGRVADADPRLVRGALPRAARPDPHHRDAQAPALPAGAVGRWCLVAALRGRGQRVRRRRPGAGGQRGRAARPVRGRRVLLACGPQDAAGGDEVRSREAHVRGQARLDGGPRWAHRFARRSVRFGGRRRPRDAGTRWCAGQVRPRLADGDRAVLAGRCHGPGVRGAGGGDPGRGAGAVGDGASPVRR